MNGKRILQNLPFALSGGMLLALWAAGSSKKAVLLCGVLALLGAAALGRAPALWGWRSVRRFGRCLGRRAFCTALEI